MMEDTNSNNQNPGGTASQPSGAGSFLGCLLGAMLACCLFSVGLVVVIQFSGVGSVWELISGDEVGGVERSISQAIPALGRAPTPVPPRPTYTAMVFTLAPSRTPLPTNTIFPSRTPTITPTPTFTPGPPTFTPTRTPGELPGAAQLLPITGIPLTTTLGSEANSAAIWAGYLGYTISPADFQSKLPRSDNPEKGFVGSITGVWGRTPPYDYGVHAAPVADLLKRYNVNARAIYGAELDDVRAELASGRPVIAWVVGQVGLGGSTTYRTREGDDIVVAPYERAVVVIGYDRQTFKFLDGDQFYDRPIGVFQRSWGALRNMAIVHVP